MPIRMGTFFLSCIQNYSVIFGSSGLGERAPPWSRTEQYTSVHQSQLVAVNDVLMI